MILIDKKANVNIKESNGLTASHYACREGFLEIVRLLVSVKDVDVNIQSKEKYTPIQFVCCKKRVFSVAKEMILLLHNKQADINLVNNGGTGPLHLACEVGPTELG